jgi:hypothetical protein
VTGSDFLKQNSLYHVNVAYQGYDVEKTLEVSISDFDSTNANQMMKQTVEMYKSGSEILEFDVSFIRFENFKENF